MKERTLKAVVNAVKFDRHGLVCAIIQDIQSGEVLMQAYMNREAIKRTLTTGRVHFFSRSRQRLWLKGEESGHIQRVRQVRLDCDGDCLLVLVEQLGGACHEGYRSCFFRRLVSGAWRVMRKKVFDPKQVYRHGAQASAR